MIHLENVNFTYDNHVQGIKHLSLSIRRGEVLCLCGASGCGKTTVTRLINGLIPHFFKGKLEGTIMINGRNIAEQSIYDLADNVSSVFQNPRSQFFCLNTTSELAFASENNGVDAQQIKRRITEVSELFHMKHLLNRSIFQLSGGQKQMIACAAATVSDPGLIVLDEPSSNLDIKTIKQLKQMIALWKEQGKTIVIAEHRLNYLTDVVDRFVYLRDGEIQSEWTGHDFKQLKNSAIREMGLRAPALKGSFADKRAEERVKGSFLHLHHFRYRYKKANKEAVSIDSLTLEQFKITALIGNNGAGKSTFARCLCGLEKRFNGKVSGEGIDWGNKELLRCVSIVFQDVNCQLFTESVADELRLSNSELSDDQINHLLETVGLGGLNERHPLSLSGGQKQRLAIAVALSSRRKILIFDEPTSGLDGRHMEKVAEQLNQLRSRQKTILLISHDYELVTRCADHIVHLDQGQVVDHYALTSKTMKKLNTFFSI